MALTPAQQITQLYVGYFHRAPDPEGLNYWIGRLTATNDALSFQQIAQSFSQQAEAHALYPFLAYPNFLGSDVESFINEVYQNLFNRAPDAAGKAYWANELLSGNVTTGEFIAAVIGGAQNSADGQDLTIVTNKTTVAEYYATEVANSNVAWSLETAKAALEGVNATEASVELAQLNIDAFVNTGYWPGTEPGPEDAHQGTAGNVDLTAGQALVAQADAATPTLNTYVSGTVNGTGDNEATFTLNGDITAQVTLNDIPVVTVKAGPNNTSVTAKGWNDTERLNIVQPSANIAITDIQSSSTYVNIVDANRGADQKIELTYDAQGVVASNSTANIGVRETFGQVILGVDGLGTTSIDTINLDINDVAGHDSTLEALRGVNTKTLDIAGGYEGGKFKITQALDKTLTTLDASEVVSDLDLNISDAARKAINATLGQGDDVLRTGNTLNSDDVFNGGAGRDTLIANLTSGGQRAPTSTNIEVFDLTFNGNAVVNFAKVDDVDTVKIRESSDAFRLWNLDKTVETIEVSGDQANSAHHIRYDSQSRDSDLTVKWTNAKTDSAAGALQFQNVGKLNFIKDGEGWVDFTGIGSSYSSDAWEFDITKQAVLTELTVENIGKGDLRLTKAPGDDRSAPRSDWDGLGDIGGTNAVTDLVFKTSNTGNIEVRNVRNVESLQNLSVEAGGIGGDILIKSIGWHYGNSSTNNGPLDPTNNDDRFDPALLLDTVNLAGKGNSDISIWEINALYRPGQEGYVKDGVGGVRFNNGATISTFDVKAESDSDIKLVHLYAGDVLETNIEIENTATVSFDEWYLSNNVNEGSSTGTFTVSGQGEFKEIGDGNYFHFSQQAVRTQDFSGLTNDTVRVTFLQDKGGVTFVGTDNNLDQAQSVSYNGNNGPGAQYNGTFYNIRVTGDAILGGQGNDNISAGGGNDFVFTGSGKQNIVDLGSGNDYLVIAKDAAVTATLGAGSDTVYVNGINAGNITDFNLNADTLKLDLSNINSAIDIGSGSGFINYSLVNGAGTAITDNTAVKFQNIDSDEGGKLGAQTTVINLTEGQFASINDVQVAIQTGSSQIWTETNHLSNRSALLLSWIDTDGDQHLSVARIVNDQTYGTGRSYNFDVVDLIGLDATNSHLNTGNLSFVA